MSIATGVRSHASVVASRHASRIAAGDAARRAAAALLRPASVLRLARTLGEGGSVAAGPPGSTPGSTPGGSGGPAGPGPFIPEQRPPSDALATLGRVRC